MKLLNAQRFFALSLCLAAISTFGCTWDSKNYDHYVTANGDVVVCKNNAGTLDYIEFSDGKQFVRCSSALLNEDTTSEAYKEALAACDVSKITWGGLDAIKEALSDQLCPKDYMCYDENGDKVDKDALPDKVHCGIIKKAQAVCKDGDFSCGDNEEELECVDPNANNTCGATGCLPSERGVVCTSNTSCSDKKCVCQFGLITCGDGADIDCVDPKNDETCGATSCDNQGENCTTKAGGTYKCTSNNNKDYACTLDGCEEGKNLCYDADLQPVCKDNNDMNNCGACNNDCTKQAPQNEVATGCTNGTCVFECIKGYATCDLDGELTCVDLTKPNDEHCGSCNHACDDNYICNDKLECVAIKCLETPWACFDIDKGICVNTNTQCGPKCETCDENHTCKQGVCVVEYCDPNTHRYFDENGNAIRCDINTDRSCASQNNQSNNEIENCVDTNEKAYSVGICEEGTCGFKCIDGYHKSSNQSQCEEDTVENCGKTGNKCETEHGTAECDGGNCVAYCEDGYTDNNKGKCVRKQCETNDDCGSKKCLEYHYNTGSTDDNIKTGDKLKYCTKISNDSKYCEEDKSFYYDSKNKVCEQVLPTHCGVNAAGPVNCYQNDIKVCFLDNEPMCNPCGSNSTINCVYLVNSRPFYDGVCSGNECVSPKSQNK